MNKSERMKPVIRVAESREQAAAKALGEAQQFLADQLKRLEELKRYREEYRSQAQQRGAAGITVSRFLELQRFLTRLDQAVSEQEKMVLRAEQGREQRRRQWFDAHGKTKVLERVVDRLGAEEARDEARRDQKETDEIAQRRRRSEE